MKSKVRLKLIYSLHVLSHVSATQYGCQKCLYYGKNSNLTSFKGGCYTPHTHAAIDRTLTTILVSFPIETSSALRWSYWKNNTSIGWTASVSCHMSMQGIKFELPAEALPFCYPRPHNYVLFYLNSINIAFRTVNVLAFHKTLRLKDSCSNSDWFRVWRSFCMLPQPCHVVSRRLVMKLFLRAFSLCRRFM